MPAQAKSEFMYFKCLLGDLPFSHWSSQITCRMVNYFTCITKYFQRTFSYFSSFFDSQTESSSTSGNAIKTIAKIPIVLVLLVCKLNFCKRIGNFRDNWWLDAIAHVHSAHHIVDELKIQSYTPDCSCECDIVAAIRVTSISRNQNATIRAFHRHNQGCTVIARCPLLQLNV